MAPRKSRKRSADDGPLPRARAKAARAGRRSSPSASTSAADAVAVPGRPGPSNPPTGPPSASAAAAAGPSESVAEPPAAAAALRPDLLWPEEKLDLAGSQHLATTRDDVDVDPVLAAYAEAELERAGKEAWDVWNSSRSEHTRKLYAKGKRVWFEWCRGHTFRDGPLVRELKVVLWLKEYVLRITTTHRRHGVNRASGLLGGGVTEQKGDAAAAGRLPRSPVPCGGGIAD